MYYRTYTCISNLIHVIQNLYLSYGTYTGLTKVILALQNWLLSYGSCSCVKVPVGTISRNRSYLYRYISGMDISPLQVQIITDTLYGSNRSYDWTYTYFSIREYP